MMALQWIELVIQKSAACGMLPILALENQFVQRQLRYIELAFWDW